MKILLNDRPEEFEQESISVREFLILMKFSFRMRIVSINGTLVPNNAYDSTFIKNGDEVHMHYLMSGG